MKIGLSVLFAFLVSVLSTEISAQFVCNGPRCSAIQKSYGGYYNDFQSLYIPKLTNDMQVSQSLIATSIVPFHVNLEKFTFGVYGALSYTDRSKVIIRNSDTGSIKNESELGFAVQPGGYFGFNLGWLLALSYNSYLDISGNCNSEYCYLYLPFLSRFDIYGYGSGSNDHRFVYTGTRVRTQSFNSRGFSIRFHAIDGTERLSSIIKFSGVNVGYSSFASKQIIKFDFTDEFSYSNGPLDFQWKGNNNLDYLTFTRTQTVDARTGFTILKSFSLYGGAGGFSSRSNLKFSFYRTGEIKSIGDVDTTRYSVGVNSTSKLTINGGYYIGGVNVGFLTLQGTTLAQRSHINNKRAYSVLLGLTFNY